MKDILEKLTSSKIQDALEQENAGYRLFTN